MFGQRELQHDFGDALKPEFLGGQTSANPSGILHQPQGQIWQIPWIFPLLSGIFWGNFIKHGENTSKYRDDQKMNGHWLATHLTLQQIQKDS